MIMNELGTNRFEVLNSSLRVVKNLNWDRISGRYQTNFKIGKNHAKSTIAFRPDLLAIAHEPELGLCNR
jgi:hypothetical protein